MRTEECISLIASAVTAAGREAAGRGAAPRAPARHAPARHDSPGRGSPGAVWADLGCGSGAFTAALAALLGPGSEIHAVDADEGALQALRSTLPARYPGIRFLTLRADFTGGLSLPALDGALVANALHFQPDTPAAVSVIARAVKRGGTVVVVEYDVERAGPWVPFPVPFALLSEIARRAGLGEPRLVGSRASRWHGRMYAAALSVTPG